jgi:hypothetical protein
MACSALSYSSTARGRIDRSVTTRRRVSSHPCYGSSMLPSPKLVALTVSTPLAATACGNSQNTGETNQLPRAETRAPRPTVASNRPDIGTPPWFDAVDVAIGVTEREEHGPDPGSEERLRSVDHRVFVPPRRFNRRSIANSKALYARRATRHNDQFCAIGLSKWSPRAKRA